MAKAKVSNARLIYDSGVSLDKIDLTKLSDDDLYELATLNGIPAKKPTMLTKAKRVVNNFVNATTGDNQDLVTGSGDVSKAPETQPAEIAGGAPASPEESRFLMGAPKDKGATRYFGEEQFRKPTEDEAKMYEDSPTLIQQFFQNMPEVADAVGMSPDQIADRRRKYENAAAAVELNGGRVDGQVYDQFVKGLVNEALLGLPQAVEKARGEDFVAEPKGADEQIARGAGSLTGFIVGAPGKFTKMVMGKLHDVAPALKLTGEENLLTQIGKQTTSEAVGLGMGTGSAATGEALSQTDPGAALKVAIESVESGALTGAVFGATKGAIPGNAPVDKIIRIATGVAALDVTRGRTPVDERELNQKIFDYGLDVYFLWKGIPRSKTNRFERDIINEYEKAKAEFDATVKGRMPGADETGQAGTDTDTQQPPPGGDDSGVSIQMKPYDVGKLPALKTEEAAQPGDNYNLSPTVAAVNAAKVINERSGKTDTTTEDVDRVGGEFSNQLAIYSKLIDKMAAEGKTEDDVMQAIVKMGGTNGYIGTVEQMYVDGLRNYVRARLAGTEKRSIPEIIEGNKQTTKALPAPEPKQITGTPDMKPDYSGASIADKGKFPVHRVPVENIKADPEAFQFKMNVNKEGEQVPLQGEWNDLASGNLLLWQRKDGELFVANGHHRLAHAKRMGQKEVNAQVLREEDGYTIRDARNLAAESNILEGKGTIYDHAEYFRTTEGYDDSMASKRGIKGRGYVIGKDATDNLYWLFKGKDLTPEQVEAITKSAPKDEALQGIGAKYAMDNKKADPVEIANFMRAMSFSKPKGGGQEDLFGFDDTAIKEAEAQAKEVAKIVRQLKEEKQAISLAKSDKKIELAQKHGIDISDKDAVRKRIEAIDREIESWDKWYVNPELVKIVRERAGLAPKEEAKKEEPLRAEEGNQPLFDKASQRKAAGKTTEGFDFSTEADKEKAKAEAEKVDEIREGVKKNEGESEDLFGEDTGFNLTSEGQTEVHRGEFKGKQQQQSGNLFASEDPPRSLEFDNDEAAEREGYTIDAWHGTRDESLSFRAINGLSGHFGTRRTAEDKLRFDTEEMVKGGHPHLVHVRLRIKSPVRMSDVHFDEASTMAGDLVKKGVLSMQDIKKIDAGAKWDSKYGEVDFGIENNKAIEGIVALLKQKGYDGIVYKNNIEGFGDDSYIPFSPKQIAITKPSRKASGTRLADRGDAYADRSADQKKSSEKTPEEREEYSGRERKVVELPELVEMAKDLLAGKFPNLKKIIGRDPAIRGAFFPRGKESFIELQQRLFSDPDLIAKVLAHEIGHAVDYLPDHDIKRGNILGRIASLKKYGERLLEEYPDAPDGILTKEDKDRFKAEAEAEVRAEAERDVRTIVEEVIREVPVYEESGVTPDMILGLLSGRTPGDTAPEIMEYLKRASTEVKKNIAKQAIRGVVDEALRQFGTRVQVGTEFRTETVTRTEGGRRFSQAWVKEVFKKKVEEEIQKRRLWEWKTITKELKDLTHEWKPFDPAADPKYTKYRYGSEELYADAISVLFNEPDLLKEKAPNFTKAFFNFLENKPEVKKAYDDLQDLMGRSRDELLERREQTKREMYETGEKQTFYNRMRERLSPSNIWRDIKKVFIDENIVAREILDKADTPSPYNWGLFGDSEIPRNKGKAAKYWLEEIPYMIAPVYEHTMRVQREITDPLKKAGATISDLGLYLELRREATERREIGNPGGFIGGIPDEQLDYLRRKLGAEKFAAVQQAAQDLWKLRQENVIPMLKESGMYSDKLMRKIEENENYATFETFLEGKYGQNNARHILGYIHMQRGTLGNIRNPFVATMMKDAALMRAAQIKMAKRAVVEALFASREAEPAKTTFNGRFHEIKEPAKAEQGLIAFLEGGKVKGYYVPKDVAETFYRHPIEGSHVISLWQAINQPLRAILVSHNPLWMVANVIRDALGTVKNLPGASIPKLLKHYKNALGEAWDDAISGEPSARISEMLKKRMLVTDRQLDSWDREYKEGQTEYDLTLQTFGQSPVSYRNKVIKPFAAVWDALGRFGKFTERWGKLAGEGYLREIQAKKGYTEQDIAHKVRSIVSTPDPFRRGAWNVLTNNLFLFSNIGKEGFRASWEAANESPGSYVWKTIKYNVIPKIMFAGAMYGAFGDDLKKLTRSVSEYMRENYLVVPLMFNGSGKAVYLTIPQDYTGQVIGGLVANMLEGKVFGKGGMFAYGSEQTPYNLNPLVDAAQNIWAYYMRGQNPHDDFRGRELMTDDVFKAGGAKAHEAMGKHLWNTLGGSAIYRFKEREEADRVEGEVEKILRMPGGNIVGRFLRIGNYGETEHLKGEIVEPVERQLAQQRLDVKDRIIDLVNKQDGKEPPMKEIGDLYRELRKEKILPDGQSIAEFRKRVLFYSSQAEDIPKVNAIATARSVDAKAALLSEYQKEMSESEYKSLVKQLYREGHITESVLMKKNIVEKKANRQ